MGTPNTSSGSHHSNAVGAPGHNPQPALALDSHIYVEQMVPVRGPSPANQYRCVASQGQYKPQRSMGNKFQGNQAVTQAQQQPSQEHPHRTDGSGSSHQFRPCVGINMADVHNKNSPSSNGGHTVETETLKQLAAQDDPMDVETQREANDGGAHRLKSPAPLNSAAQHQGPPEDGRQNGGPYEVSNQDEHSALPEVHACCRTPCPKHGSNHELDSSPALSHTSNDKKSGNGIWRRKQGSNEEKGQSRTDRHSGNSKKDKETDLRRKLAELEEKLKQHYAESNKVAKWKDDELRRKDDELRRKDDELRRKDDELRRKNDELRRKDVELGWKDNELRQEKYKYAQELDKYQSAVTSYESQVTVYRTTADKMSLQLSSLEQQNSKAVGGTGAHKDTPAIPPNLVKSVFNVNEAALTCAKAFITFLEGRGQALEKHEALQNLPEGADKRYRKYAVEAYLCSRLFAGFENDSYLCGLDCVQGSERFLPPNYQQTDFFLQNQDPEKRRQRYLEEYDSLQNLGMQKVMEGIKSTKAQITNAFHLFCCRKLVNVMSSSLDAWFEEFGLLESIDYSRESLLYHLASKPKSCEKFLKPFVNLAMMTFLLHRLAFQFQPPARIFRYAVGARFDPTYMENAVPIDDDDSDEEVVVGLMLVPGFQVGATIVKCTVYLVPSSTVITQVEKRN